MERSRPATAEAKAGSIPAACESPVSQRMRSGLPPPRAGASALASPGVKHRSAMPKSKGNLRLWQSCPYISYSMSVKTCWKRPSCGRKHAVCAAPPPLVPASEGVALAPPPQAVEHAHSRMGIAS